MNIEDVVSAGRGVIKLLNDCHNAPHREMLIDPALYGYLKGRFSHVSRQHYVHVYGSNRPKRIDFPLGGTNPVVLEFAVRPATAGGHLYGSQNSSELRKLCRVPPSAARLRALLLLDLYHQPLNADDLRVPTRLKIPEGEGFGGQAFGWYMRSEKAPIISTGIPFAIGVT